MIIVAHRNIVELNETHLHQYRQTAYDQTVKNIKKDWVIHGVKSST